MKRKKILYLDQFAISNMYNEGASQTYDTPSCLYARHELILMGASP